MLSYRYTHTHLYAIYIMLQYLEELLFNISLYHQIVNIKSTDWLYGEHERCMLLSRKYIDLQEIYIILCLSRNLLCFCLDYHNNPLTDIKTKTSDIILKTGALTFLIRNIAFPIKWNCLAECLSQMLSMNIILLFCHLLIIIAYCSQFLPPSSYKCPLQLTIYSGSVPFAKYFSLNC